MVRPRARAAALVVALTIALVAALGAGGSAPAAAQGGGSGRFIALSDIHLDPFADPALVPMLAAAPPEQWPEILARSSGARYGSYGRDTAWGLLASALDEMRRVEPDPAFLVLTGDLLAHRFRDHFVMLAGSWDEAQYHAFVARTVTVIGQEIARRFPGRQVLLTVGNEDSDCGDYKLTPDGVFLRSTLALARSLTGAGADAAFTRDWLAGRGYDVANRAVPSLRMISVNSVYLSARYRDACGSAADPGDDTLTWLAERLAETERRGETAWLLMHIPPGADAYATLHGGACPDGLTAMWAPDHARRFLALVRRYARTIGATFAGHTHMDEFRLLGRGGEIDGFMLGTPAISPVFGQNPGFHVYAFDGTGRLVDRETWRAGDLATVSGSSLGWQREYVFSQLWQEPQIDRTSLTRIDRLIGSEPRARSRWFSTYPVGRTSTWRVPDAASLPPTTFRAYHCAIGRIDADEYRDCLCGAGR